MQSPTDPRVIKRILLFSGLIVTLSMGIRHSFGLYLSPMTLDLGWGREQFAFAIALQNLLWGAAQPFTGMIADVWGARRVLIVGALLYLVGLVLMAGAATPLGFDVGAGLLVGLGLSGTTYSVVFGVIGRVVPAEGRSKALGLVSAAGSIGQFLMLPLAQSLISQLGWSLALLCSAMLIALILPASRPLVTPSPPKHISHSGQGLRQALQQAFSNPSFLLLGFSYFVCGFQVTFVGTHLPAYLADAGQSAELGTLCLALIGLFNIAGTYLFGQWGGVHSKKHLLAVIYFGRVLLVAWFINTPLSPVTAMFFAGAMGFLWLATVPLTNGLIAQIFGVQYMATLGGIVFCAHQVGSFIGVWMGGRVFDTTGSYDWIWYGSMALGVTAAALCLPIKQHALTPAHAT